MATTTETDTQVRRTREDRASWGVPMIVGILLIIGGIFALSAAMLTTLVSVIFLGVLLLIVGVVEIVSAFSRRRSPSFLLYFLAGLFTVVVGALFLWRPLASLASLTLLFTLYLFASGLFHCLTSLADRYPRWGWDLVYGLVSIALGVYIVASWPVATLLILGVIVAIEIIARGAALVAASWVLRDIQHGRLPAGYAAA